MIHLRNTIQYRKIESLLQEAGESILEVYESSRMEARIKLDFSPVTRADHLSSELINRGLEELFPGIPVVDEENPIPLYGERRFWNEYFLLDPLDGTREFIKRNGEFCINLAHMRGNRPVASWIYQPATRTGWSCFEEGGIEVFGSGRGEPGVIHNPEDDGRLRLITSRSHTSKRGKKFIDALGKRFPVEVIRMGSALKQVAVATGGADLYVRGSGCSEWDTAAGHLMVIRSGGLVVQWDTVQTLLYNKATLINPPFIMLSKKLHSADFLGFIKNILPEED